jgi:DNA repair photolyase
VNVAEVLRSELARRTWRREPVASGAATDPYQPAEGRYRLSRACLEALREARTPFHIITRSPMIVRDVDVLAEAASWAKVSVSLSIPTLDEEVWRTTEPGTPPPRQRFRAVRCLVDAGIDAGVAVAPVLPGISDRPEQVRAVVEAARESGAAHVWASVLHLRPGTREHFLAELSRDWPEHVAAYEQLYGKRSYLPGEQTMAVRKLVARLRNEAGPRATRPRAPIRPPPEPEQLALVLD